MSNPYRVPALYHKLTIRQEVVDPGVLPYTREFVLTFENLAKLREYLERQKKVARVISYRITLVAEHLVEEG